MTENGKTELRSRMGKQTLATQWIYDLLVFKQREDG